MANSEIKSTYIYSIEGKDIILAGKDGYKVKEHKKFKGSYDFCGDIDKIKEISRNEKDIFFTDKKGKQYAKALVNLTFEYGIKEFNVTFIDKNKVYLKFGIGQDDLKFIDGVAMDNEGEVVAVIVDKFMPMTADKKPDNIVGFSFEIKKSKIKWTVHTEQLKTLISADAIRTHIYINNFKMDGVTYTRFKRTTGAARQGSCTFIRADLHDKMMEWSYCDLDFPADQTIDLAGLEASISLTSSSVIDNLCIKANEILIIDERKSIFTDNVMETKLIDGQFITEPNDNMSIVNNIWDGQSCLDSSIFGIAPDDNTQWVNGKYHDKGYLLLRQRYYKSACFNTNIQKYFKDNDITEISQLKGFTLATDIKSIKMITTKSSIKYAKYGNVENWLRYLDKVQDDIFWIVKYEKPTHYFDGDMVQGHYQLCNTVQLSKEQTKEVVQPSIDYIKLLKTDSRVLRYHLDLVKKADLSIGDINSTNDMIFSMLQVSNKMIDTDLVKNFRQDIIDSYVNNLRQGHILQPGTYAVLLGNGLEMLKASIGKFDGTSCIGVDEVICPNFKEEGTKLIGCRSPHITMGNLWLCKIVTNIQVNDYFNLSNNIVYINAIGNNILQRLNSADFDSDSIALFKSDLIYDAVAKHYDKFKVPVHDIEPKPILRYNTNADKANLDIACCSDMIGKIINMSQVLNSKLWDTLYYNPDADIDDIYADICTLAIMSNLAIDGAKREYPVKLESALMVIYNKYKDFIKGDEIADQDKVKDIIKLGESIRELNIYKTKLKNLIIKNELLAESDKSDVDKEVFDINFKLYSDEIAINEDIISKLDDCYGYDYKLIRPIFFRYVNEGKKFFETVEGNYVFKRMNTTMDYLQEAITEGLKDIEVNKGRCKGKVSISLAAMLDKNNDIKISDANYNQIDYLIDLVTKFKSESATVWASDKTTSEKKYAEYKALQGILFDKIDDMYIKDSTLKKIIFDIAKDDDKYQKIQRKMITLLYRRKPNVFISLFKANQDDIIYLKKVDADAGEFDVNVYGIKLQSIPNYDV